VGGHGVERRSAQQALARGARRLKDEGIYDAGRIRLYVAEHRLIYEAVIQGDADAAAFYVEQHIKRVERDIAPK
jgi:DNA-binding FadR family transcriptional regulator